MRARYYHPVLRRFLNQDPIGFEGGLNWYAFADGNPVTKNDPRGLSPSWQLPPQLHQDRNFSQGYIDSRANPVFAGFVAGATGAAAVTVGAPVVTSGLVASGISATAASATVTGGLGLAAIAGGTATVLDPYDAVNDGDWNRVAYNTSSLAGGAFVGGAGGGRYIANGVSPTPSSVPQGKFIFGDQYMHYQSGKGTLRDWIGTGPTPQSGGGTAAFTASGVSIGLKYSWIKLGKATNRKGLASQKHLTKSPENVQRPYRCPLCCEACQTRPHSR
jgi:hypothetical protein